MGMSILIAQLSPEPAWGGCVRSNSSTCGYVSPSASPRRIPPMKPRTH